MDDPESIPYRFFDASQATGFLAGNLPHWRQDGVTYFVTFRLADSVPNVKLLQWRQEKARWLREHPGPHSDEELSEYRERFPRRFQGWLDAGWGDCLLGTPEVAACVERALRHFDGQRYRLGEHVVMPNHVHVVVLVPNKADVSRTLHAWKSYSANAINRLLGRSGSVWQRESFDYIVRSAAQLARIEAYIEKNRSVLSRTSPKDIVGR